MSLLANGPAVQSDESAGFSGHQPSATLEDQFGDEAEKTSPGVIGPPKPNLLEPPIHHLPTELLIDILLYSFPHQHKQLSELHTLAKVCVRWYRIVTTSPHFWTTIDFNSPKQVIDLVLKKNPHAPLVLLYAIPYDDASHDQFLELIKPLAHRFQTLVFHGQLTPPMTAYLENHITPTLSDIRIHQHLGLRNRQTRLQLFPGVPIRYIELSGTTVPWDSSRLSRLKVINIHNIKHDLPTLAELRGILAASPHLASLKLEKWHGGEDKELTYLQQNSTPIKLSSLSTLVISNVPTYITHFLLSTIDASACQHLIISQIPAESLRAYDSFMENVVGPSIRQFPTCDVNCDGLSIRIHEYSVTANPMQSSGHRFAIKVVANGYFQFAEACLDFCDRIKFKRATKVLSEHLRLVEEEGDHVITSRIISPVD